jgi:hypothetical protein
LSATDLGQSRHLNIAQTRNGKLNCLGEQESPNLTQLLNVRRVVVNDSGAAMRLNFYEAVSLELQEGLTHGNAADS